MESRSRADKRGVEEPAEVKLASRRGFGTGLRAEIERRHAPGDADVVGLHTHPQFEAAEPELPSSHLVFVPTPQHYLLLERDGPAPKPGDQVELEEGYFVVGKLGRAPLPGERRPCAFLLSR